MINYLPMEIINITLNFSNTICKFKILILNKKLLNEINKIIVIDSRNENINFIRAINNTKINQNTILYDQYKEYNKDIDKRYILHMIVGKWSRSDKLCKKFNTHPFINLKSLDLSRSNITRFDKNITFSGITHLKIAQMEILKTLNCIHLEHLFIDNTNGDKYDQFNCDNIECLKFIKTLYYEGFYLSIIPCNNWRNSLNKLVIINSSSTICRGIFLLMLMFGKSNKLYTCDYDKLYGTTENCIFIRQLIKARHQITINDCTIADEHLLQHIDSNYMNTLYENVKFNLQFYNEE